MLEGVAQMHACGMAWRHIRVIVLCMQVLVQAGALQRVSRENASGRSS